MSHQPVDANNAMAAWCRNGYSNCFQIGMRKFIGAVQCSKTGLLVVGQLSMFTKMY